MDNNLMDLSHIKRLYINLNLTNEFLLKYDNFNDIIYLYNSLFLQLNKNRFGTIRTLKESEVNDGFYFGNPTMVVFNILDFSFEFIDILIDIINNAKQNLDNKVSYSIIIDGKFITSELIKKIYVENIFIKDSQCKGHDFWYQKLVEFNVLILSFNKDEIYGISQYADSIFVQFNDKNDMNVEDKNGVCPELVYYLNICEDGSITPCFLMKSNINKDYVLGNIQDSTILDIYYSEKFEVLRNRLKNKNNCEICKSCPNRNKKYNDIFSVIVMPD